MHHQVEDSSSRQESSLALDKQLEAKDLPASVVTYCAGFPVYRTKDISKEKVQIKQNGRKTDNHMYMSKWSLC